jgi:hypothetical protein
MKRKIAVFAGIILVLIVLWWVIQWVANGGWPSSGPVGATLPPNIQYVKPADGEKVEESYGFCVHFYYPAGNGMGEDPQDAVLYFFDGINVTKRMIDIVVLEYGYPAPVGEPCYTRTDPLNSGWHTVKVRFVDSIGKEFDYTWRFQVLSE